MIKNASSLADIYRVLNNPVETGAINYCLNRKYLILVFPLFFPILQSFPKQQVL